MSDELKPMNERDDWRPAWHAFMRENYPGNVSAHRAFEAGWEAALAYAPTIAAWNRRSPTGGPYPMHFEAKPDDEIVTITQVALRSLKAQLHSKTQLAEGLAARLGERANKVTPLSPTGGQEAEQMREAVKLAYRKHHLGDDSIGWDELSDALGDALANVMGDGAFVDWMKGVKR